MQEVGRLWAFLGLRTDGFSKSLKATQRELQRAGREFQSIGKGLTLGLTAPLAGVAAASGKFAIDFNKNMANVGTLLGGITTQSSERLNVLKNDIQELALDSGKSTQELSEGMYQVVSAFGDTVDAARQLEVGTKLGIAGLGTTQQAISAISAATKAYGDTSAEAQSKVADLMIKTIQEGETNLGELAPAVAKVTALSADLGVTQEELFSVFSATTGALGSASEVSTQLKGVYSSLIKPTKELQQVYDALGVSSGKQLISQNGFHESLTLIQKTATETGVPFAKLIGSVEGLGFANAVTAGLSDKLKNSLNSQLNAAGALEDSYSQQVSGINSLGQAFQVSQRVIEVSLQRVGDAIFEVFGDGIQETLQAFGDAIGDLVGWFNTLDPTVRKTVVVFGALLAAVGPVVTGIGGLIALLGGGAVTAFTGITVAIAAAGAALFTFGQDFNLTFEGLKSGVSSVLQTMSEFQTTIVGAFDTARAQVQAFNEVFPEVLDTIQGVMGSMVEFVREGLQGLVKLFQDTFGFISNVISTSARGWAIILGKEAEFEAFQARSQVLKQEFSTQRILLEQSAQAAENFNQKIAAIGNAEGIRSLQIRLREVNKELRDGEGSTRELRREKAELTNRIKELGTETVKTTQVLTGGGGSGGSGGGLAGGLKTTGDEAARLNDRLNDLKNNKALEGLQKQIDDAINIGDLSGIDGLKDQFETATREGLSSGYADALSQGGDVAAAAQELIDFETQERVDAIDGQIAEKMESMHEESVNAWSSFFENAITGQKFNLEDMFKQVAVGFAGELANSVFGSLGDITSPQGLGGSIFGELFGGGDNLLSAGLSELGLGDLLGDSVKEAGSVAGQEVATGLLGSAESWGLTAGTALGVAGVGYFIGSNALDNGITDVLQGDINTQNGIDAALSSNVITATINPVLDAIGLGSVGSFFGGAPTNPETVARLEVEAALNPILDSLSLFGENLRINARLFDDFTNFDADRDFFGSEGVSQGNGSAFLGAGNALAPLFENENLDAGQLGVLLAEGLGGSLDELKALFSELGVSQQEYIDAQIELGNTGEASWLQVQSQINEANVLFGEGRAMVGDLDGAMRAFLATGGRGRQSLVQFQNVAIEAQERGIQTLDQLRQQLVTSGEFTAEEINSVFSSLETNGITTIQQFVDSSETQLISLVASFDAALQDAGQEWVAFNELSQETRANFEAMDGLEISIEYRGVFTGEHPAGAEQLSLNSPSSSEVLPQQRSVQLDPDSSNVQRVARNSPINLNIDARSDADVEARIMNALTDMHNGAVQASVNAVVDLVEKGQI